MVQPLLRPNCKGHREPTLQGCKTCSLQNAMPCTQDAIVCGGNLPHTPPRIPDLFSASVNRPTGDRSDPTAPLRAELRPPSELAAPATARLAGALGRVRPGCLLLLLLLLLLLVAARATRAQCLAAAAAAAAAGAAVLLALPVGALLGGPSACTRGRPGAAAKCRGGGRGGSNNRQASVCLGGKAQEWLKKGVHVTCSPEDSLKCVGDTQQQQGVCTACVGCCNQTPATGFCSHCPRAPLTCATQATCYTTAVHPNLL
jgi:hypothetical protein